MDLPPKVVSYLQDEFLEEARPFCFLIDGDYRLVDSWGQSDWCGLSGIRPAVDMREPAPFLVGMPISAVQKFEFIEMPGRAIVTMHVIPDNGQCYVVLLDARREHASIQSKQQSVNELRLMHGRQHKLIARQRDLISELVEAKSELDHHRREAERISANKSRFIAMMSHEFRTPLASIINYAELAGESGTSSNEIQKSIETISRSAMHLTSLVEAVLDDASLDAGQVELLEHDFEIVGLLNDMAAMMAPMAAEKGLSFAAYADPDVPKTVYADEVRLRQILINLLGNAVKFTVEGGVKLTATYNDGRLVVTVSDTGPGISIEDQERVFQAFERGRGRAETGAGLGLTITLRLVELMRGEVSLDSMPGEGCTVSVHIPVMAAEEGSTSSVPVLPLPGEETIAAMPLSVLICDDDEDMVTLVEHYLHRSGYGLITSSDSSEAIAKTLKFDPDLVLMDCNVPGVGGVVAARVLREQGYSKPIVALTASKLSDEQKSAFTRFFRKPASMQKLLTEIKRLTH
ncbi:MAG: response regulator [Gammaproteobacteria bacterium]|nr:response regulator [Gammaproteobacteria bacterium]MBT8109252.1 response regulator [Gammaproteobacteria bacterium]NND47286.1 response regulator [Woeseiaceae bacterium]NNL43954.1 response regulator [Woeseiaceae bacterium]